MPDNKNASDATPRIEREPERRAGDDRRADPPPREHVMGRRDTAFFRRRDGARARMDAPISIVVEDKDGKRVGGGTANLKNLSLRGALISDLKLQEGAQLDPEASYTLRFQLMAGPLAGMKAVCHAVRFDPNVEGYGVRLPLGFIAPIN